MCKAQSTVTRIISLYLSASRSLVPKNQGKIKRWGKAYQTKSVVPSRDKAFAVTGTAGSITECQGSGLRGSNCGIGHRALRVLLELLKGCVHACITTAVIGGKARTWGLGLLSGYLTLTTFCLGEA